MKPLIEIINTDNEPNIIEQILTNKPMSNKQQTAVDIAFEKLASQGLLVTKDYKNLVAYREAKELEKQQIKDACQQGFYDGLDIAKTKKSKFISSEQYYNETYNQ
jgi:ribosomal protein S2